MFCCVESADINETLMGLAGVANANGIKLTSTKYSIWLQVVKGVATSIHYKMQGYNTLLSSHNDHYFFSYDKFSSEALDDSVFSVYESGSCYEWPGSDRNHVYPMKESVEYYTQHVTDAFDQFTRNES